MLDRLLAGSELGLEEGRKADQEDKMVDQEDRRAVHVLEGTEVDLEDNSAAVQTEKLEKEDTEPDDLVETVDKGIGGEEDKEGMEQLQDC